MHVISEVPTRPVLLLIAVTILMSCTPNTSGSSGDVGPSAPTQASTVEPSPTPNGPRRLFAGLDAGWTKLPVPPEVRTGAAIAWTGAQLLAWGGYVYTGYSDEVPKADGFSFDARAKEWSPMADSALSPRTHPGATWTGRELLVWGGIGQCRSILR